MLSAAPSQADGGILYVELVTVFLTGWYFDPVGIESLQIELKHKM